MSREFEVVVTPEMSVAGFIVSEAEHDPAGVFRAMTAHPSFRAQLRAWAAEEMRGLVPARRNDLMLSHPEWNACRAETLANIEKWANLEDAP